METSLSFKLWLCFPAGEPGLGARPAETDGVWTEPHDAGCHAHPGGPASETAPPSGGGEAQIPKPGGAAHPTAAVSLILSNKHSKYSQVVSVGLVRWTIHDVSSCLSKV